MCWLLILLARLCLLVSCTTVISFRKAPLQRMPSFCHPMRGPRPPSLKVCSARMVKRSFVLFRLAIGELLDKTVPADVARNPHSEFLSPLISDIRWAVVRECADKEFQKRPESREARL